MQFSKEQIEKAIAAKSAEELLETAKAEGLSLTKEETEHYFKVLHTDPADAECIELSKEEQENVAGGSQCVGGKSYSSDPPYWLITTVGNSCPQQESSLIRPEWWSVPGTCGQCQHRLSGGYCGGSDLVNYCTLRTVDNDPYR